MKAARRPHAVLTASVDQNASAVQSVHAQKAVNASAARRMAAVVKAARKHHAVLTASADQNANVVQSVHAQRAVNANAARRMAAVVKDASAARRTKSRIQNIVLFFTVS